jgi:hypothetical protein
MGKLGKCDGVKNDAPPERPPENGAFHPAGGPRDPRTRRQRLTPWAEMNTRPADRPERRAKLDTSRGKMPPACDGAPAQEAKRLRIFT